MYLFYKQLGSFSLTIPRRWRGYKSVDGLFMHTRNPKKKSPFPPSLLSVISGYDQFDTVNPPQFSAEVVEEESLKLGQAFSNAVVSKNIGRLFAVVQLMGKQRIITAEDILVLEGHFSAKVGEKICLEKVLLVGSKDFTVVGRPLLPHSSVRVEATVVEKTLDHTKPVFYQISKENYRRISFHQSPLCCLRINSISVDPEFARC